MSTNYQQTEVTSPRWTRAARIFIENPLPPHAPSITFAEERVSIDEDGDYLSKPRGNLTEFFVASGDNANIGELFQPVDPQTMQPVGDPIPYGYFVACITGHYLHCALKRDAELAATQAAPEGDSPSP